MSFTGLLCLALLVFSRPLARAYASGPERPLSPTGTPEQRERYNVIIIRFVAGCGLLASIASLIGQL